MQTNSEGILRVTGLPNGEYQVTAGGVQAVLSVPPVADGQLTIQL